MLKAYDHGHASAIACTTFHANMLYAVHVPVQVLATIRRNRVAMMGLATAGAPIDYAEVAVSDLDTWDVLPTRHHWWSNFVHSHAQTSSATSSCQLGMYQSSCMHPCMCVPSCLQKINRELNWAMDLYGRNPDWPVLDVTFRGIEETAARILKMLNERSGHASPQWCVQMALGCELALLARATHVLQSPGVGKGAGGLRMHSVKCTKRAHDVRTGCSMRDQLLAALQPVLA